LNELDAEHEQLVAEAKAALDGMKELIAARPHLFDAYERAGEKLCPVIAAMCDDYRNARCTEMGLAREVWDKMSDESTPLRKRARLIAMLSGASTRSIRMSSMRILRGPRLKSTMDILARARDAAAEWLRRVQEAAAARQPLPRSCACGVGVALMGTVR
jgi:hypothetical protein